MRNKPHLAAVEAIKDALVLSTMRFREELVPVTEYEFPEASIRKPELRMAHQLVEALVAKWDPEKYTDEYRANLLEIIESKRRRQKPDLQRQEQEADAKVVDLMERLRRSLGAAAGEKPDVRRRGRSGQSKGTSPKRVQHRSPESAKRRRGPTSRSRRGAHRPAA
jgi:DNA end-binding protein Ku